MKFYMLETNTQPVPGKTPEQINEALEAHIAYIDRAFECGTILITGKKGGMRGGNITIMKAKAIEDVQKYCDNDPLCQFGMLQYNVAEFVPRLFYKQAAPWVKE